MSSTPTVPTLTAPGVDAPTVASTRCQMCPHDLAQHDTIGLRYCDATRTSALSRSCLCRV